MLEVLRFLLELRLSFLPGERRTTKRRIERAFFAETEKMLILRSGRMALGVDSFRSSRFEKALSCRCYRLYRAILAGKAMFLFTKEQSNRSTPCSSSSRREKNVQKHVDSKQVSRTRDAERSASSSHTETETFRRLSLLELSLTEFC